MTNLLIKTTEEINELLNGVALTDAQTQVIDGELYYVVEFDESAQVKKWAPESLYNEYKEHYVPVEEAEDVSFADTFFDASPSEPENVSFTLQTIGSSLQHENVTVSRTDAGAYLTSGTLTVVSTGSVIRSYTELVEAVDNDPSTKILFVKNKTGN